MTTLVLFDIDGTLVHGNQAHLQACADVVTSLTGQSNHFEISEQGSTLNGERVGGLTDSIIGKEALRLAGVSETELDAIFPKYRDLVVEQYRKELESGVSPGELIPGIPDLLADLRARDVTLGLATGNMHRLAEIKLTALGIWDFFDGGAFGDDVKKRSDLFPIARKALGEDKPVVYIGDTRRDVIAAREAGVPVIAVATGHQSVNELLEEKPNLVLDALTADCADVLLRFARI